jgi:hypothetical protein
MAIGSKGLRYNTLQTHYLRGTLTPSAASVTLGVVPPGSIIIGGGVVISTVFNAGTTNVIDIGTTADPDGLATDLAAGTAGLIVADELATSNDLYTTTDVTIVASYAQTGTAATTGVAHVFVQFIPLDPAIEPSGAEAT